VVKEGLYQGGVSVYTQTLFCEWRCAGIPVINRVI